MMVQGIDEPQPVSIVIGGAHAVEVPPQIVSILEIGLADECSITWPSNVCGIYEIDQSEDLLTWVQVPGTGQIVAHLEQTSTPITIDPNQPERFYRVRQVQ